MPCPAECSALPAPFVTTLDHTIFTPIARPRVFFFAIPLVRWSNHCHCGVAGNCDQACLYLKDGGCKAIGGKAPMPACILVDKKTGVKGVRR